MRRRGNCPSSTSILRSRDGDPERPYGYAGTEAPEPVALLPEEGPVELLDPGMEVVVCLEDGVAFDEAVEAAAQRRRRRRRSSSSYAGPLR